MKVEKQQKSDADADVELELNAIRDVLGALTPLSGEARASVITFVFNRLGISITQPLEMPHSSLPVRGLSSAEVPQVREFIDIRTLKDEKQPSSAREMAVLVAFYLSELAPAGERKPEISADDIRQYFKQAAFKLPAAPEMTLVHTRNAGYLDAGSARGLYRLNAVGYNLVAHSLPAGPETIKPKRRRKNSTPKKTKR